jgi:hypothetical protein
MCSKGESDLKVDSCSIIKCNINHILKFRKSFNQKILLENFGTHRKSITALELLEC